MDFCTFFIDMRMCMEINKNNLLNKMSRYKSFGQVGGDQQIQETYNSPVYMQMENPTTSLNELEWQPPQHPQQRYEQPQHPQQKHRYDHPHQPNPDDFEALCIQVKKHIKKCKSCRKKFTKQNNSHMMIIVLLSLFILFLLTKIIDKVV